MTRTPDLRHARGNGVSIAIVDSGAHALHPHLASTGPRDAESKPPLAEIRGFGIERNPAACRLVPDFADRHGHGTACAAVVRWGAPGAHLVIARVLDVNLATTVEELELALVEIERRGDPIVNLSLGAVRPEATVRLGPITERLLSRGVCLVAAERLDEEPSWPASVPGVLSVGADPTLSPWAYRVEAKGRIVASPFPRPIGREPPERNFAGTSFAAPRVAALAARALELEPGISRDRLVEILRENAPSFGRTPP